MRLDSLMAALSALGESLLAREEEIKHWQQRALAAEEQIKELKPQSE